MKIKNIISSSVALLLIMGHSLLSVCATAGTEPLQSYFSDDGTLMKIFTSVPLSENADVLIGNETLNAEIINTNVQICTTFLIDNSTSMPYSLREEVTTAISDYVSIMPASESVKIAVFDTQTTVLADEYSSDKEFINYELSKVDFKGKASLVYDSIMNIVDSTDNNQDVYYRTVLITDGVDSVEGTSFDYMQNVISGNSRYHIDVVKSPENLKVIPYYEEKKEDESAEPIIFTDNNISKICYSVISYRMVENENNPNNDEWEVEVSEKGESEIYFDPDTADEKETKSVAYILDSECFDEDGIYEVKCVAYDITGNASEETTHTFVIQREKDFLVYIPESNSEKGTGLYQFNESRLSTSSRRLCNCTAKSAKSAIALSNAASSKIMSFVLTIQSIKPPP